MPWLLSGTLVTVGTVLLAMFLGLLLGLPMAVAQVYGPAPIRRAVGVYVWFFRGVPILVLLFLFYYGFAAQLKDLTITVLGRAWHIQWDVPPFLAACVVLGLTSAAYQSQIFRGAISSLPTGQLKAARALGMSNATAVVSIVLPQAMRLSIPGWSNEYSILLKDSVLVSVVGAAELLYCAETAAVRTEQFGSFYLTAALLYFLITHLGVSLLRKLEKILSIPGYTRS